MTRVLISRTHYPVTVLGPGARAGIWLQGCTIRCPGCASLDTWNADPKAAVDVADVLAWVAGLPSVDGVTISGGEPTDQPAALRALVRGLVDWRDRYRPDADVLLFTGRDPEWLDTPDADVLAGVDAVVAGPYRADLAGRTPLRGSENQVLAPLTPLGERRYRDLDTSPRNRMQVHVDDESVWMIGIPLPGDLAGLRSGLAERGVRGRGASWRS